MRRSNVGIDVQQSRQALTLGEMLAYASPLAGTWVFYNAMWSVLPGAYGKYFGLPLTSIAAAVLIMRLFDGVIDMTVGYLSDRHRARGGSRKSWVFVGGLGTVLACYFLFAPPAPVTSEYYLLWSVAFFLVFTLCEIPHLAWGSELAADYQERAKLFAVRSLITQVGAVALFALPLLPIYPSSEYTPEVLRDLVRVGAVLSVVGLGWMWLKAPSGTFEVVAHRDSPRQLFRSIVRNEPLLLYFAASSCVGIGGGMWFGLLYFFMDSYLGMGDQIALMFLMGTALAMFCNPLWVRLIKLSSKSAIWALGVLLFAAQLLGALLMPPQVPWAAAFVLILAANIFFTCNDVAGKSILGDVVDYGKWRFNEDRGATYFACDTLLFKIGVGAGGGLSLALAGALGFAPNSTVHSPMSILGLKWGFAGLPLIFLGIGLIFIMRTPLDRHRHQVIRRRLDRREALAGIIQHEREIT